MNDFHSKLQIFNKWYEHSSVRSSPRRVLGDENSCHYFSASIAPVLAHPKLGFLRPPDKKYIEVQFLYRYLRFTEYLETQQVNNVILAISKDEYLLDFREDLKLKAYNIYCDEAYHALQAADMTEQVKSVTGIEPLLLEIELIERLKSLYLEFPVELRSLFSLFFVAVAENLVSHELNGCVKDKGIHPEVASLMRDHARDEVAHAQFFEQVLIHLHKKIGRSRFNKLASFLPALLEAYLIPGRSNLEKIFSGPLSKKDCKELLDDWYNKSNIDKTVMDCSVGLRKTIEKIKNMPDQ